MGAFLSRLGNLPGLRKYTAVMPTARVLAGLAIALAALPCPAQNKGKDLRDEVTLKSGKTVHGRVVRAFDPDELLVMQGGKRVRLSKDKVAKIVTINDHLREFLDRRAEIGRDAKAHFELALWAGAHDLDAMARLQALRTVDLDGDHEAAHEMLGHRKHRKKGWLWPRKSRWLTREKFDEATSSWGTALELASEHFLLRTDGGIGRGIEALIDLERFYRHLFSEYGEALGLQESIEPIEFRVWNDEEKFPGWTGARIPYFVPNPHADASFTFYRGTDPRPVDLITLATQQVLYRCLVLGASPGTHPQDRLCAWLEIGLAQWFENRFRGDPGRAELRDHQFVPVEADLALSARRYGLENVLHLTLRGHFYGSTLGRRYYRAGANVHWATVHMFVTFLMDKNVDTRNPGRLIAFLRAALGEGKGDSSRAFDKAMGKRVEEFEEEFRKWLATKSGG